MTEFLSQFLSLEGGMTPLLVPFMVLAGLIYMITESTRNDLPPLKPDLKKDEVLLRTISNTSGEAQSWKYRLSLTNRRIIHQVSSWPLVGVRGRYLVLRDIESVSVTRRISLLGLVLFTYIWMGLAPLGVLLLTILILRPLSSLTLRFHRQGLGPLFATHRFYTGSTPSEYVETMFFAREMQRQKDAIEGEPGMSNITEPEPPDAVEDLIFKPIVFSVLGFMALGVTQRLFQDQISVESSLYLAFYSSIPVYMGAVYGKKAGAIVGFMGMMMLFAVASPTSGLALGNTPSAGRALLSLLLMTTLGYQAAHRRVGSGQYLVPILVLFWIPISVMTGAAVGTSTLLIAPVFFAAGVTGLVAKEKMKRAAI
jgi:hypothetical protein